MGFAIVIVIAAGCAVLALLPRYMVAVAAWVLHRADHPIAPQYR